jgi:ribose 5-phosphate isomerase B
MKIAIGGDHAGFEYKQKLIGFLKGKGHTVKDYGPFNSESCDYPDFAHPVASAVAGREEDFGILICGSGNGVCFTANKHPGIRAALCWNTELAALARQHNNANILCIPARFVDYGMAEEMTEVFLSTSFEGGRHQRRIDKVDLPG